MTPFGVARTCAESDLWRQADRGFSGISHAKYNSRLAENSLVAASPACVSCTLSLEQHMTDPTHVFDISRIITVVADRLHTKCCYSTENGHPAAIPLGTGETLLVSATWVHCYTCRHPEHPRLEHCAEHERSPALHSKSHKAPL